MQLKCSRYIFNYTSPAAVVEDYILRADDLASQTYGRDKYFSRLNQVLEQARFLGWPLPRFGAELPEELTEIPPAGVDHIFENQGKLLVDVAPTTHVMLEDGRYCPVKMLPSTTAAGDLVWRCHLLVDSDGTPYIQRNKKKYRVKTKGTKIMCQAETLAYDGKYVFECFGGEEGVWPVPFLPEFFSDRTIAQKFSPEEGVVEVVYIHEETPIKVLAHDTVPWYRPLEINYTKALPMNDAEFDPEMNVANLIDGWDELKENGQVELGETDEDDEDSDADEEEMAQESSESGKLVNVLVQFNELELQKFKELEKILSSSKITSKVEADKLRKDPKHKDKAEKWLVSAVNRLRIISNCSAKIGALFHLIGQHHKEQILIIQPRQKWASKLGQILNQRGVKCQVLDPEKSVKQVNKFYEGQIKILITADPQEELFVDPNTVVISLSSFDSPSWLEWAAATQQIYTIAIKDLELADYNYVGEHETLEISSDAYDGASYDILKLETEVDQPKQEKEEKVEKVEKAEKLEIAEEPAKEVVENEQKAESPVEAPTEVTTTTDSEKTKEAKEPKVIRPKFKIKIVGQGQGRPKTAATYEKAIEMANKHEKDGKKCEIYGPEGDEPIYITGIGELDK